jgi:hypothetical protein
MTLVFNVTSHFIRQGDESISTKEMIANAGLFIVAGSETSATLLSGLFFHLLKNPEYFSKLKDEVRSSFNTADDMTFQKEAKLPYLQACIEEALRIYPPVPVDLPRRTPPEGSIINGELVPGGVRSSIKNHTLSNNSLTTYYRHLSEPPTFALPIPQIISRILMLTALSAGSEIPLMQMMI